MFLIHGRRKARIKRYRHFEQACFHCGAHDLDVNIYMEHYHIFFIPIFPVGDKTSDIRCHKCKGLMRVDSIQKHYEDFSRTPFYLYTVPLIFAALIGTAIAVNMMGQKEKALYISSPAAGDVYKIREDRNDSSFYYFLKVSRVMGDSVIVNHSYLQYNGFVSGFNENDFFVRDEELFFSRSELKSKLEKGEIVSIDREYGDDEGFNRMK
jgi:hypothetical protein